MFRFAYSVVLWGGRCAADRYHGCVGGALTVFWPHSVCPHSRVCAFPVYTAQAPRCSIWSEPCIACGSSFQVFHKSADSVGPAFCAFPARAAQAARSLTGALSPAAVHLLPSAVPASVSMRADRVYAPCVYSRELASSHNPPGRCRPSGISRRLWLETGSLFAVWLGVPSLGPSLPLSHPPCLLPLAGDGPVRRRLALLWNCSVALFCERPAVCSAG